MQERKLLIDLTVSESVSMMAQQRYEAGTAESTHPEEAERGV